MIGLVENAMLAQIKAATDAGVVPYAYGTRETWPKNFDAYLMERQVKYPAVWVAFGGGRRIEREAPGQWRVDCSFAVVVAAENLRNEESTRHGGTAAEPGSYQLAVDVLQILGDQTLGLENFDALKPASIEAVETSDIPKLKQLSIYAVVFDTGLYYQTEPGRPAIESPFERAHFDWDPAPGGHVDPAQPLPQDAAAILSDTIELEQQ